MSNLERILVRIGLATTLGTCTGLGAQFLYENREQLPCVFNIPSAGGIYPDIQDQYPEMLKATVYSCGTVRTSETISEWYSFDPSLRWNRYSLENLYRVTGRWAGSGHEFKYDIDGMPINFRVFEAGINQESGYRSGFLFSVSEADPLPGGLDPEAINNAYAITAGDLVGESDQFLSVIRRPKTYFPVPGCNNQSPDLCDALDHPLWLTILSLGAEIAHENIQVLPVDVPLDNPNFFRYAKVSQEVTANSWALLFLFRQLGLPYETFENFVVNGRLSPNQSGNPAFKLILISEGWYNSLPLPPVVFEN